MHEVFKIKSSKPIPKISTITHQFWKTPKPRFQNMKMHENERLGTYQVKKNLESHLKSGWSEREWFGRWEDRGIERERDREKMKSESHS